MCSLFSHQICSHCASHCRLRFCLNAHWALIASSHFFIVLSNSIFHFSLILRLRGSVHLALSVKVLYRIITQYEVTHSIHFTGRSFTLDLNRTLRPLTLPNKNSPCLKVSRTISVCFCEYLHRRFSQKKKRFVFQILCWLFRSGGATRSDKIEPLYPMFRASGPIVGATSDGSLVLPLEN